MSARARGLLFWGAAFVLALGVLAMLIPSSPVYLPRVWTWGGHYNGKSTRQWINQLDSGVLEERHEAIFSLGAIGADAERAIPRLAAILTDDPDPESRGKAALSLSKMEPASKAALPALIKALDDEFPLVRWNALMALFRLKKDARPAVPALLVAMKKEENYTAVARSSATLQEMAALAVGRASSGTDEAVALLSEALDDGRRSETRRSATQALGDVGGEARSALPKLRALLNDDNVSVREAAAEAIEKIEGK